MNRPRPEIERAMQFVVEHLERRFTVADVARAIGLSEFHLHRSFHAAVGESIGSFVTRKRLEHAALRLAYEPETPITTIALESGYSSSSNFSKAFSGFFGCSPSRVRTPTGALAAAVAKIVAEYGKDFRPEQLYTVPPEPDPDALREVVAYWNARVRFVDAPGCSFACLASPRGYDLEAIEATWGELIQRATQLGLCGDEVDAWSMAYDSPELTAPERCRYHACIPCAPERRLAAPLRGAGHMKPGRYAVFDFAGAPTQVGAAYRSIYSCWFRESSVVPEDFTPLDHYIHDGPRDGRVALEMWFRIRPR